MAFLFPERQQRPSRSICLLHASRTTVVQNRLLETVLVY
jgi:hypothetical protein